MVPFATSMSSYVTMAEEESYVKMVEEEKGVLADKGGRMCKQPAMVTDFISVFLGGSLL